MGPPSALRTLIPQEFTGALVWRVSTCHGISIQNIQTSGSSKPILPLSKSGCQMLTRPLLLYGWSMLPRHLNYLPIYEISINDHGFSFVEKQNPTMPSQITSLVASSPGHPTCRPKWLDLRIALPLPMVSIKIITSCLTKARQTQPLCIKSQTLSKTVQCVEVSKLWAIWGNKLQHITSCGCFCGNVSPKKTVGFPKVT